ncbi:MAG: lyase [Verrucomicrobiota bacterium]
MPLPFFATAPCLRNITLASLALAHTASAAVLNSPSQDAITRSINIPLIDYGREYNNGAFTYGSWYGGASVVLAVASFSGNTSADARLLQQLRFSSTGGNEICANGGYPAQHELHVTGMFAIAKQTPRIWSQLTTAEKSRIDLIMKASLVSCAFTTSDYNPYISGSASGGQRTLDADYNVGRDWNPNYREGMLGSVLVGMVYFGGPAATQAILDGYSHAQFVTQLGDNGLVNARQTFNWKAANSTSTAPTGTQIENAVRYYKVYGYTLATYMSIYNSLANNTYGRIVSSGLNNGAGINGYGRIASGAETLPNPGATGMLTEFNSSDGQGPRSSLEYAYTGYVPHQTHQLALIAGGLWPKGTAAADNAATRIRIGNTDLWYKMQKGYYSYAKGASLGFQSQNSEPLQAFAYLRSLWEDVLLPYHLSGTVVPVDADTDGDGTDDATEIRLGLNPASGVSRFMIWTEGNGIRWPSKTGLTFVVQRSSGTGGMNWVTIATVPGMSGTTGFTDPSPPAKPVFYRVGLNP